MRRREKEITDPKIIADIINRSRTCRLGLVDGDEPYVVPVNFGYRDRTVYIHSAPDGRKINILRENPKVCVLFDVDQEIEDKGIEACKWGTRYRSVIAFGKAAILEQDRDKIEGLNIIMQHYGEGSFEYDPKQVAACVIIKIRIDHLTGKSSGY